MPAPIKKLADKFLSSPKTIEVSRPATANASIDQRLLKVDSRKKKQVLEDRLHGNDIRTAIVFCNRKTTVRELSQSLKRSGLKVGQIQGDMEQAERIRELDRFKDGEINILIASDVAARGLDVKDVSHVFNYDVPWHPDDYIHRIGRTGRAGRTGIAITLATKADQEAIEAIEKLIGSQIRPVEGPASREAEPETEAEPEANEPAPRRARRERAPRRESRRGKPQEETAPESQPEVEEAPRDEPKPRRGRREEAPRRAEPRTEARAEARAEPKRARPAEPRPEKPPRRDPAPADPEGLNGPSPSFLDFGFGD
jgi:superfamily II DNA/RNA helicase